MAVNKNFVVKNGLEVNTKLILADATTNKVGIGSTGPRFELDVAGGIGATDVYVSGIATVIGEFNIGSNGTTLTGLGGSIGIGTAIPAYLLDVRAPVSTGQTALYVQGDLRITGDLNADDISLDDATIANLTVTEALNVSNSGISTFSGYVDINAATDISGTLNVGGATTIGGYLDVNAAVDFLSTLNVGGATTIGGYLDVNAAADFSNTLNVTGVSTFVGFTTFKDAVYIAGITTFSNYAQFLDNQSAYFGNGADLRIYHNGSHSFIQEQGDGNLYVQSNGGNIYLRVASSYENGIIVNENGSVELYYDDVKKFETIGSGVTATETLFSNQLSVSGVSTLGTIKISSGIITASSGIVTYYGDGSELTGVIGGIGINTSGGLVGFGVTYLHFYGSGVSTTFYDSNSGIATIFFQGGGGGGASIGIGTTPGDAGFSVGVVTAGNLWYNSNLGRLFIYYYDGSSSQWVDAAPFNVAGTYLSKFGDNMLAGLGVTVGAASTPSVYFTGDSTTGFFSPSAGNFNVVSVGSNILNINPSGIIVTGIATAQDFDSLSDVNYKENIVTVSDALSKVDQLRGVRFDWKESGLPSYGVIAQELQEVLPELVHGNDPKTVNYNGIIGVLIEAIKELKAEVDELKSNQN